MKATTPLVVSGVPFGIIFGAVAITSGLSPAAAAGMSAFVYAGSAQFIATGLVAGGVPLAVIILTTFVVNLRHALYSASLGPYMKRLSQRWLMPLGFLLTDETFLVTIQRYERDPGAPHKHWFMLGSAFFMYTSWQLCTWVGIVAGQSVPDPRGWGLDFAMEVTFTGMLVPMLKNRPTLAAVIVASVTAVAARGLPNQLGLMVAALLGVAAGMVAQSLSGTAQAAPTSTEVGP